MVDLHQWGVDGEKEDATKAKAKGASKEAKAKANTEAKDLTKATRKLQQRRMQQKTMSTKRCLLPWIARHAAWTVNRYVTRSDGFTSGRWGSNFERAICEFGEILLYLPQNIRNFRKPTYERRNDCGSEKFPKQEKTTSQPNKAY